MRNLIPDKYGHFAAVVDGLIADGIEMTRETGHIVVRGIETHAERDNCDWCPDVLARARREFENQIGHAIADAHIKTETGCAPIIRAGQADDTGIQIPIWYSVPIWEIDTRGREYIDRFVLKPVIAMTIREFGWFWANANDQARRAARVVLAYQPVYEACEAHPDAASVGEACEMAGVDTGWFEPAERSA